MRTEEPQLRRHHAERSIGGKLKLSAVPVWFETKCSGFATGGGYGFSVPLRGQQPGTPRRNLIRELVERAATTT